MRETWTTFTLYIDRYEKLHIVRRRRLKKWYIASEKKISQKEGGGRIKNKTNPRSRITFNGQSKREKKNANDGGAGKNGGKEKIERRFEFRSIRAEGGR